MLAGDADAMKELYNNFYQYLFSNNFAVYPYRELVKDCIHETFLSIWVNREKLPQVSSVGGYLNTCVRRKIMDALRKESLENKRHTSEAESQECSYEEAMIAFQEHEATGKILKEAFAQLTPKQKEVIRLRFFENRNYDEIAALSNCEARTIYNRVYEAIERLRRYFSIKHPF
ncbi:sigma-70 family RNA polymerase sigma factor [Filimonas effusa]|uniref:Sigma-70 family RNA polymerase sigma factor n=2 Tax=Filimonas effusa TaxID=2508721 RepID=A0A4Q1D114_9BACT|nr:sigma-70 family RNA polymerase sigma factor [Filimonas effusa]